MKLYSITFNDGQWHSGELPVRLVIAGSLAEALETAKIQFPLYRSWDMWGKEVEFLGYEITITKK